MLSACDAYLTISDLQIRPAKVSLLHFRTIADEHTSGQWKVLTAALDGAAVGLIKALKDSAEESDLAHGYVLGYHPIVAETLTRAVVVELRAAILDTGEVGLGEQK